MKTADKMHLVKLLTDDSRMQEYDDMFDFSTVISCHKIIVDNSRSDSRMFFTANIESG